MPNKTDPMDCTRLWSASQGRMIEAERRLADYATRSAQGESVPLDQARAEVLLLRRQTDTLFADMMAALAAQRSQFRSSR